MKMQETSYKLNLLDNGRLINEFKAWLLENNIFEIQDLKEKLDIGLREKGINATFNSLINSELRKTLLEHNKGFIFLSKVEKEIDGYVLKWETFLTDDEVVDMFFKDTNTKRIQKSIKESDE
ncbi:hypothetical protein [Mycoplasma sp. VS42A]|uniref:hypothetical protein n=1 Tax=unclassified Mycoplasma TaxID=2683645 RepID=UPI003A8981A3